MNSFDASILSWFNKETEKKKIPSSMVREQVIITILSCFAAILIGKFLALNLPFSPRPITNIALHFVIPYGVGHRTFSSMSSFPSDHATFMFSLAIGIWLIARRVGVTLLLYVTTIVLLPRINLGLHYPTDIIAGCFIGIVVMLILHNSQLFRTLVVKPLIPWFVLYALLSFNIQSCLYV